jgi:hypothetical protein
VGWSAAKKAPTQASSQVWVMLRVFAGLMAARCGVGCALDQMRSGPWSCMVATSICHCTTLTSQSGASCAGNLGWQNRARGLGCGRCVARAVSIVASSRYGAQRWRGTSVLAYRDGVFSVPGDTKADGIPKPRFFLTPLQTHRFAVLRSTFQHLRESKAPDPARDQCPVNTRTALGL